MCWNKEVSFITLIIGTVFTILLWLKYNDTNIRVIACIWQFVLFMQLFEGLSWVSKETNNETLSIFSTKCAFIFNVLQPIAVALLCILISDSNPIKYTLATLIVIYLIILLYSVSTTSFSQPLYENDETCHHLQLYWWNSFSNWIFIFYIIILTVSCLSLKPLHLGIFQISYIILTFFLSNWIYPCSYGSIWCWFAAFAPLLTYIYLRLFGINS